MNSLDQIKAKITALPPEKQLELLRWLEQLPGVRLRLGTRLTVIGDPSDLVRRSLEPAPEPGPELTPGERPRELGQPRPREIP